MESNGVRTFKQIRDTTSRSTLQHDIDLTIKIFYSVLEAYLQGHVMLQVFFP